MKNARMKRAVGLLVGVKITGVREYSYKIPIFAQVLVGLDAGHPVLRAKDNPVSGWPAGSWIRLWGWLGTDIL